MDYHKTISKLFDHFYNKIYNSHFKLELSRSKQKAMVDNFIKALSVYYPGLSGIGINFLIQYFAWSFKMRSEQITKRKISLNWIVGKKTLDRYVKRKSGEDFYVHAFLTKYGIDIDNLRSQFIEHAPADTLDKAEELEKMRFTGEAKLFNCLNRTTLYNHRSVHCLSCENRTACKILLSKQNPSLFKKRGYQK